jgi:hypothetical protein
MNDLIHATPVHPSLCLQYFILLFTIATITTFILLLLLLFHSYHHYKTVATDKPLRASLFPSAAELTTHLLRLINILWLPLCRINKFGLYFPQRLLRSPILVGHQATTSSSNFMAARCFLALAEPEFRCLPSADVAARRERYGLRRPAGRSGGGGIVTSSVRVHVAKVWYVLVFPPTSPFRPAVAVRGWGQWCEAGWPAPTSSSSATFIPALGTLPMAFFLTWPAVEVWRWVRMKHWYVSNVSIILDAPCLFIHHLLCVLLHFVVFLCIFWN